MGVVCVIIRLTDETIDELVATPRKVWHFQSPDHLPKPKPVSLIGCLLGKKPAPYPICCRPSQPNDAVDLDKSWNGLDFLISNGRRDAGICRLLTMRGLEIKEEVGYGKPQAFRSQQVKEYNTILESISVEVLHQRYRANDMTKQGLYPSGIWKSWGNDDVLEYVIDNFKRLQTFIRETERLSQGVIVFNV